MNEKMNSNSMQNMYKNNTSVLIQERARLSVSRNLTIWSLMVVFAIFSHILRYKKGKLETNKTGYVVL